ncbi:dienelactone hydrolase family protein [Lysobacter arvi]|uniref:Alpha/beta fold hydrolase n=1 Tax=Lysobacter arvi TaxID=3038776 RepID=A0ABU1CG89_9GAMM|nr:alpha/beta fold hydrolase [Lysobacter arvi]MDR0183963.1 alpha/beta fold hydrolase [Lysobacter arvi]
MDRRRFLRHGLLAGAAPATLALSGCANLIDVLGQACPEDPAESGGIDWTPDVMHPVFFGFKDYTPADGAPATLRVFYPSHQTPFDGSARRILKTCLDRWPTVLFLHGQPPCLDDASYYLRWRRIPEMLARSGYVVVVPKYSAALAGRDSPLVAFGSGVIDWARMTWEHARWVDKRPGAVAIVGHSYGAILGAQVARSRGNVGAYVSLSAAWDELHGVDDVPALLAGINAPSMFMWGDGVFFEDMDAHDLWTNIPNTKHAFEHPGEHFDYLPDGNQCGEPRGACAPVERVSAELTALFLQRHVPLARSNTQIPIDLSPPPIVLTPKQQFYGGPDFTGLDSIKGRAACKGATLRWKDGTATGSRALA